MTDPKAMGFQLIEIMGHQRVAGWVQPVAFGGAVLLHVTMPAPDPQEIVLDSGRYVSGIWCGQGSRIRVTRHAVDQHVGIPSVFRMTACTEEQAAAWQPADTEILERVEQKALAGVGGVSEYVVDDRRDADDLSVDDGFGEDDEDDDLP